MTTNNDGSSDCSENDCMCPHLVGRSPAPELVGLSDEYPFDFSINGGNCPVSSICDKFPLYPFCRLPDLFCEFMGLMVSCFRDGVMRFETFYSFEEGELIIEDGSVTILDDEGRTTAIDSVEAFFGLMDGRRERDGSCRNRTSE